MARSMSREPDVIDLRSDTVTRPDRAMLEFMANAPLGDDVFGDDPTAKALEERAAALTGKEAGLFLPSGTMANSAAIAVHTRPGDEVILESLCHSFHFECAGAARLWGVQLRVLPGQRGVIPVSAVEEAIRPVDIHFPTTRLVILEQTSNISGGCVLPLDYLRSVSDLAKRRGLAFHIDGARLFNAAVASGVPASEFAATADSLMFCVSKGLGAPAGSLLVGSGEFIAEARRVRKVLGGGLRQAGVLAACGLHALETGVERLAEDHRRARETAATLVRFRPRGLDIEEPETNMVFLRWPGKDRGEDKGDARYREFVERLRPAGLLAVPLSGRGVRLVFHKDVDDGQSGRAAEILGHELDRTLP